MSALTATLVNDIADSTGIGLDADSTQYVAGGDINEAFRVTDVDGRKYFLKLNSACFAEQYAAEAAGLKELARAAGLIVPGGHGYGVSGERAWLLLDWLEMSGNREAAAERLGRALADMHRIGSPQFGWHSNNAIGATPQLNDNRSDWVSFYAEMRLQPQLEMAAGNGAPGSLLDAGYKLIDVLPACFAGYVPMPSLLHGDLWGGNWSALADGTPVLFDPAVYYGDREADIAMTRLFGGFPDTFYSAYEEHWPLHEGHTSRVDLYNLYHVLNHFNLFGGGYAAQAEGMLGRLLSRL